MNANIMPRADLSFAALPQILIAGRFPLADRAFSTRYRGRTHALHLHGYGGRMELAGQTVTLAPDDLTLSPAGMTSSYDLDRAGHHWCIHFTDHGAATDILPVALHHPDCGMLREAFAHVASLHGRRKDRAAAIEARLAVQSLLLRLVERPPTGPGDVATDRAATFIDAHFHEDIGVAEIAAAAGRSPVYLARRFKVRFGTTMPHRLLHRRAEHARYLLEATDLPIWRIAERVGIPNAQHFNKTLRRLLGASPTTIRAGATGPKLDPDRP